MKKFLLACVCGLMAVSAEAANTECAYTPLQSLIRNVRDVSEVQNLINRGVVLDDPQIRCGGSLMQLAIVRGNPDVLKVLLEQDIKRVDQKVSLEGFSIPDAPRQIPVLLFAAYYSPNESMMRLMVQAVEQGGNGLNQVDDSGRNLLWYLEKNPVLRNTQLSDELRDKMLVALIPTKTNTLGQPAAPGTLMLGQPQTTSMSLTSQEMKIQPEKAVQNSVSTTKQVASDSIVEPQALK